ncbi:MAG: GNAT family N-acetyltransferase [Fimbriimonadaceae bacterium]
MRVGFQRADFGALAQLWNDFLPPRYAIDGELLKSHTVESPVFDWGASLIQLDEDGAPTAFVAVKRSAAPRLYTGPDPDVAHLSAIAYRTPQCGVELMGQAKRILLDRGVYRISFGTDSRHFFPGCPEDCPALRDFLTIEGFEEGGEQVDLERDLSDYEPPAGSLDPLTDWPGCPDGDRSGPYVDRIGDRELPAFREFIEREFPGRWAYDTVQKFEEESGADCLYGLWIDGRVEGFALTQDWRHRLPIGGAVWRRDLGDRWGSLGPIGVSKGVRGRGLGDAMLAAGLMSLKIRGARRCIIDWTTLKEFYGKHGFEVARVYRSRTLALNP